MDQLHWRPSHWYILGLQAQDKKDYFDLRCDFLQKSYGENSKVVKPVLVTMRYEGSNDEEELKAVPRVSQNNNYTSIITDSKSDNDNKNNNKNLFDKDINKDIKATPRQLSMPKWFMR